VRIFITGGTGFVGRHVVRRLAGAGHDLACLVRDRRRAEEIEKMGARLVLGDVTDKPTLLADMRGCDWVVHLANVYSMWEPGVRNYVRVNVFGTRNVMEAALEARVAKVVHVSTAGIFGKPAEEPFTEASEAGPVRFSDYSRTKHEGDLIAWDLHKRKGLPLVVIYPATVVGPGDDKPTGRYVADLVRRRVPVRSLEDCVLTFVHVRDVAEAIALALEKPGNIGEGYLIGKCRLTIRDYNNMIASLADVPLPAPRVPAWLIVSSAAVLTAVADVIKRPPPLGLASDYVRTVREGLICDGGKAERELGLAYTPVVLAVAEMIDALKSNKDWRVTG
jgi:dihydroflavonol-4-reductase